MYFFSRLFSLTRFSHFNYAIHFTHNLLYYHFTCYFKFQMADNSAKKESTKLTLKVVHEILCIIQSRKKCDRSANALKHKMKKEEVLLNFVSFFSFKIALTCRKSTFISSLYFRKTVLPRILLQSGSKYFMSLSLCSTTMSRISKKRISKLPD